MNNINCVYHLFIPSSNRVRDELTFSASDSDDAPDLPKEFEGKYEKRANKQCKKTMHKNSSSIQSEMNLPSVLMTMMTFLNHQYRCSNRMQ